VEGYSLFYPDVQQADVDKWARRTVIGHERCTLPELVASLKHTAPTTRSHRASIHFAPSPTGNSFHVVLVAGHWLTDGRGAVKILNYILNSINTGVDARWRWGEEAARLSVPLPLATGRRTAKDGKVVPLPADEVQAVLKIMIDADAASQPGFSHSPNVGKLDRSKPDVIHEIRLSPSESTSLLDACRSHGVSVTALLNVLLSMSFVGNSEAVSDSKTVPMPFFPTDRGHDLLEEYRGSVGLNLVLFTLGLPSDLLRSCWSSCPDTDSQAIWEAAKESKRRITEALVSQPSPFQTSFKVLLADFQSHDIGLIYEHEIICAILPGLLSGTGAPFYQAALPFATSIGRITDLFAPSPNQNTPPTWTIDHVANSYTVRWYRPVAHYWEWRGQTTVRIVASAEYDEAHSVLKMKEEMVDQIRKLI